MRHTWFCSLITAKEGKENVLCKQDASNLERLMHAIFATVNIISKVMGHLASLFSLDS